jgi:pyruvate dehydrogenase (quinone)
METPTVAELLVQTLLAAGVQRVYGVAGDSLNGITDAIRQRPDLSWISMRHEESAALAAGAEAHLTGSLAVCAGSCGPGNLHLINGLFDAHRSRVPVLALAAHIPSLEIGTGYFQETHPEQLFRECSHYCELISHPAQLATVLQIAIQTALTRQGVAVVVLPGDIGIQDADAAQPRLQFPRPRPHTRPSDAELAALAQKLNDAKRVTVLAGAGCAEAHPELMQVAGALRSPIVHAMRGKEFIEHDNPFDVGMTGLLGSSSGYHAMMRCDTLLLLGTDFPYRQFYPQDATILQVDIRGEQLGRRTPIDLGLIGDIKTTLSALLPLLQRKSDDSHLRKSLDEYAEVREQLDELAVHEPEQTTTHPQYVARVIDEVAAADAIFTCDVGTPTIWAARYLSMNGRRRLLGSFSHGTMASALPQAIGAQLTHPQRQVVTLSGDGGLAMLLGDLLTLRQLNLPVKMVVFNNGALAFVEMEMKAAGFLDFATDLRNPDFSQIARATDILGLKAETPAQVRPAIQQALEHPGPALVDVIVNRQELAMPPALQMNQLLGFSLYMVKAVLNGRGDEIIDLAKKSWFR